MQPHNMLGIRVDFPNLSHQLCSVCGLTGVFAFSLFKLKTTPHREYHSPIFDLVEKEKVLKMQN